MREISEQLAFDLADQVAVALGERIQPLGDDRIGAGIELAESQVLQLLAHRLHAHAAGERRIDVERLLGDAVARGRRHELQRAHVVQPVGELDQQHAHVVGNGEQELAQVLGLLGFARDEVEPLQLGEAFDQVADLTTEDLVDLRARRLGVLDRVVQQRCDDGRVVELQVGEDRGHFERMREVRIAGGARLLAMRAHGVDIGAVQKVFVGVRVVGADPVDQIVLPHHAAAPGGTHGDARRRRLRDRAGRGFHLLRSRAPDGHASVPCDPSPLSADELSGK